MKKYLFLAVATVLVACSKDEDPAPVTGLKELASGLVSYYPLDNNASDQGPNGINGIMEGPVSAYDRKGNAKGAVYFDGTDDYVKLGNIFKINDLRTLAFWVKFKELKEGMSSMELISKSSQRQGIEVLLHENKLQFFIMGEERSNSINIPISALNTEDWFFVTAVYDYQEGTMKLFLNGELKAASWAPSSVTEVENLLLGNWSYESTPRFFNGYLDDVKIFNRPLTETEVAELFNQDR